MLCSTLACYIKMTAGKLQHIHVFSHTYEYTKKVSESSPCCHSPEIRLLSDTVAYLAHLPPYCDCLSKLLLSHVTASNPHGIQSHLLIYREIYAPGPHEQRQFPKQVWDFIAFSLGESCLWNHLATKRDCPVHCTLDHLAFKNKIESYVTKI